MKFTILILCFVSILSIDNTDTLEVTVENCCQVVLMAVIMIDLEETRLFVKRFGRMRNGFYGESIQ